MVVHLLSSESVRKELAYCALTVEERCLQEPWVPPTNFEGFARRNHPLRPLQFKN